MKRYNRFVEFASDLLGQEASQEVMISKVRLKKPRNIYDLLSSGLRFIGLGVGVLSNYYVYICLWTGFEIML